MSDADVKEPNTETHAFQAEVAELLRLMVHSVYSETDIFLRELISNASDACDRLRYEAIAKPELLGDAPLKITITPDTAAGTLTIADSGIGMDRQELIDNLGTVARSGTRAFIGKLAEVKDGARLIGQFGVGFYASSMAADRVTVISKPAGGGEAVRWESDGQGEFTVAPGERPEGRGTDVRRGRAGADGAGKSIASAVIGLASPVVGVAAVAGVLPPHMISLGSRELLGVATTNTRT